MEYRRVGRSGLKVSRLSIGAWLTMGGSIQDNASHQILDLALDHGINAIDTADIYAKGAAETVIGAYIKDKIRHHLVISTKCFWPMSSNVNDRGLSRKHITESLHGSLKRLQTDYVDIFYCHRFDRETPLPETIRAIGDLIAQGKVLYWGTSCWNAGQISEALRIADALGVPRPIVEQPPLSLLERDCQREVIPLADREGLGIISFSPLSEGVLTGKYAGGVPDGSRAASSERVRAMLTSETVEAVQKLSQLAADHGCRPEQLALSWALRQEGLTGVIIGASRAEHVRWNLEALSIPWSDTLSDEIEAAFKQ